jgi:hypothetical protein
MIAQLPEGEDIAAVNINLQPSPKFILVVKRIHLLN